MPSQKPAQNSSSRPTTGSVDTVLAPAATGASGRAQNPQDPVPSHPGEVEHGNPEEGSGGDSAGGIHIPLKTKSRIQREVHRKVQGTTQATQIQINKILIRLRSLQQ